MIVWAVLAPTGRLGHGDLAGHYGGATANAAVGVGAGANVLIGSFHKSVTLQPVSISIGTGLNVAAGIGELTLTPYHGRDRGRRLVSRQSAPAAASRDLPEGAGGASAERREDRLTGAGASAALASAPLPNCAAGCDLKRDTPPPAALEARGRSVPFQGKDRRQLIALQT